MGCEGSPARVSEDAGWGITLVSMPLESFGAWRRYRPLVTHRSRRRLSSHGGRRSRGDDVPRAGRAGHRVPGGHTSRPRSEATRGTPSRVPLLRGVHRADATDGRGSGQAAPGTHRSGPRTGAARGVSRLAECRAMSRRDVAWPLQLVVAVAVVVVLVAGVWVSGGAITNDFGLAMALTAVWMGIAAAACLAIAWRRPGLRVAVIVAYLFTAIVVGGYLGRSTLIDDEVNERLVAVTPPAADRAGGGAAERPQNVLLRRGSFESVAHPAEGIATTIRTAAGARVLTL